jgi:hypothetical protein
MTIFERLDKYFKYMELTKNKVSALTGISPGLLSKGLKKDNTSLGSEKIIRLLEYFPDLSAEWLLREEGPMIIDDDGVKEKSIVEECRVCEEKDKLVESYQQQIKHLDQEIEWLRSKVD